MDAFEKHTGQAVVMALDNVNTDQIIPSREMKRVSKQGLAEGLFANLRYVDSAQGGRTADPDFLLNTEHARGASILIAGQNFGCGSSREHAVWALKEYGFRVLVAESFGSIFRENCISNGVVPVTLHRQAIAAFSDASLTTPVTVDLDSMTISCGTLRYDFTLSSTKRHMLRRGLSPIDVTLAMQDKINAFRLQDQTARPWVYMSKEGGHD